MDANTTVLADACRLLQQDLYRHLEEAEYLAEQEDWNEEQRDLIRELVPELSVTIRHVLRGHRATESAQCQSCQGAWPCQVITTVHRLIKDPDHHFLELMRRSEE